MGKVPEPLLQLVRESDAFVLVPHVRPDGDALGSMLGLALALESQGKRALRLLQAEVPPRYRFLPGVDLVALGMSSLDRFLAGDAGRVAVIALDCGDAQRLGIYSEQLQASHPLAVIDHHKSNGGFGDVSWVESDRSSTGEMVFDLVASLGWSLDVEAACCLYTAIVTDTGSFRYESTTPHTLAVAGELLAAGVRPEQIASRLYDTNSPGRLRLLQLALGTLRLECRERVASMVVTRDMYLEAGATQHDTEEFVNWPRSLASVEVAVFCREVEGDDSVVSVSLRAKGTCDVAAVAVVFGGGGHRNAAGFRHHGLSLDEVRDRVVRAVEARLLMLPAN